MSKINSFFALLIFLFVFTPAAFAETKTSGSLSVTGDFPVLSSSDGVWYPGKTIVKEYFVQSSDAESRDFATKATSFSDPDLLAAHLFMAISGGSTNYFGARDVSGNALSNKSIKSFYDETNPDELVLFSLPAGGAKTIKYTFTMDPQLGNGSYQNKNLSFDLSFGYSVTASPTPTSTPSSTPTATPIPGPTETPGPGPTSTPGPASSSQGGTTTSTVVSAAGIVNQIFSPIAGALSGILGTQTGTVSGIATPAGGLFLKPKSFCLNFWWWIVIGLAEIVLSTVLVLKGRKKETVKYLLGQGAVTLAALFLSGLLFCQWWPIVLSGLIGIAGLILLLS